MVDAVALLKSAYSPGLFQEAGANDPPSAAVSQSALNVSPPGLAPIRSAVTPLRSKVGYPVPPIAVSDFTTANDPSGSSTAGPF